MTLKKSLILTISVSFLISKVVVFGSDSMAITRGRTATSSTTSARTATPSKTTSARTGSATKSSAAKAGSTTTSTTSSRTSRAGSTTNSSSRSGGSSRTTSSSSRSRGASVFGTGSGFSAFSAMTSSSDPQTQVEAECLANYTTCMDLLIPYVISQNKFLDEFLAEEDISFLRDSDSKLRFVYDTTPVSRDGTACGGATGMSCESSSKVEVLYENYNFYCAESGISSAKACNNLEGMKWNYTAKCYDYGTANSANVSTK